MGGWDERKLKLTRLNFNLNCPFELSLEIEQKLDKIEEKKICVCTGGYFA